MANEYTPTVWKTGDVITAEKLNKIEEGIANAEGGGGESEFNTAEVTLICSGVAYNSLYNIAIYDDLNMQFPSNPVGFILEDNALDISVNYQISYIGVDYGENVIKKIFILPNSDCSFYIGEGNAVSTGEYTLTGNASIVTVELDGTTYYLVKVTGDCTISTVGSDK